MGGAKKKSVFVGLSGGVDSSVAAWLLKKQGYEVTGVFMRCYNIDGCAARDAEDARRVAEKIGIPFYTFDFEEEYKQRVVDYMIEGYRKGITPNPDVACNREIKFGLFLKRARELGADYVATGHYVTLGEIVLQKQHVFSLKAAVDKNKDQSYFLWTLTQNDLKHCLFPLGAYEKPEVRALAKCAGLPTAEKKDSQGVCFLGNIDVREFLKSYIKPKPGPIVTISGERIGTHEGTAFYTIGQRHLGANLTVPESGKGEEQQPYYVAAKDAVMNTLTVARGAENPALAVSAVHLAEVNFISGREPEEKEEVMARVRYRQPVSKAALMRSTNGWTLEFAKPQRFVAPGQSAVFYAVDGTMLGGGIIV